MSCEMFFIAHFYSCIHILWGTNKTFYYPRIFLNVNKHSINISMGHKHNTLFCGFDQINVLSNDFLITY